MDKLIIGLIIISIGLAFLLISTNQTEQIPSDQTSEQSPFSPQSSSPVQPTQTNEKRCDPSYPDVCIPPSPPDLDCDEISHKNFRVSDPDIHGFDRDRDGIGCEQ